MHANVGHPGQKIGNNNSILFRNSLTNSREYRLAAMVDKASAESLLEQRRLFYNQFMPGFMDYDPFYLQLGAFDAPERMEETIARRISRICSMVGSFSCTINNFGGNPTRSIFFRGMLNDAIESFYHHSSPISDYLESAGLKPLNLFATPFIEMVSQVPLPYYDRALNTYCNTEFSLMLQVKEICLLHKPASHAPLKLLQRFSLP